MVNSCPNWIKLVENGCLAFQSVYMTDAVVCTYMETIVAVFFYM